MTRAAKTIAEPTQPDPEKARSDRDRKVACFPPILAGVIQLVRILIDYGRRLHETAPARARYPQFTTAAAIFGTRDMDTILRRIERGILRAIALERFLVERAARGRELTVVKHRDADRRDEPATPRRTSRPRAPRVRLAGSGPVDPAFVPPFTPEEIDAQVRRRLIGRTITEICNDLGVMPAFCDGRFWRQLHGAIYLYGGSFNTLYEGQRKRQAAFDTEWDRRPDWSFQWNWQDLREPNIRRAIGSLVGEAELPDRLPDAAPA